MKKWTIEDLIKLSLSERHTLWQNALKSGARNEAAAELVKLFESSGIDYGADKRESVRLDDRIGRTIVRVVRSKVGTEAAIKATRSGLPALAGIDPLLHRELGDDYSSKNEATIQAGYVVARHMRALGYRDKGPAAMPAGMIAKSGFVFESLPSGRARIDFGTVWARIVRHAGETFHQIRSQPFTYAIAGEALVPSTTNQRLARSEFEKASGHLPLESTSPIQDLRGPSYLFAILMDDRVRQGDW